MYDEFEDENAELMREIRYQEMRREKAERSYPKGEPHVHCDTCGCLLVFSSANFMAGTCIDGHDN